LPLASPYGLVLSPLLSAPYAVRKRAARKVIILRVVIGMILKFLTKTSKHSWTHKGRLAWSQANILDPKRPSVAGAWMTMRRLYWPPCMGRIEQLRALKVHLADLKVHLATLEKQSNPLWIKA